MKRTLAIGALILPAFFVAFPALADTFQFQPIISGGAGGALPLDTTNLCTYLNSIFKLSITIAVVLAVLMIVIDGFKYMTSEAVGNKKDALSGIRSALGGLILLLASYLILFIINPQILSLSVFSPNGGALSGGCGSTTNIPITAVYSAQMATQTITPFSNGINVSSLLSTMPSINANSSSNAEWHYTTANGGTASYSGATAETDCNTAAKTIGLICKSQ